LVEAYQALQSSWSAFYRNFGVHQSKAIAELAIHADHAVARDRRNEIDARTRSVYASPGL